MNTGLLLVNLGTPLSPDPHDVKKYLQEFLTDGRVMDLPTLRRQLLVRGFIVPRRYKESAKAYGEVWTERGSPLLVNGQNLAKKVQKELGGSFIVQLGMRYQQPSIQQGLEALKEAEVGKIIIFPLFPQYASASTGSVLQRVCEEVAKWHVIPTLHMVSAYPDLPGMIEAWVERSSTYDLSQYDHVLFSYHGLPLRHVKKALKDHGPSYCYRTHCFTTTKALTRALDLEQERYTTCFQSRLGRDPWIQPYTDKVIEELAKKGAKRLLVFSPSFTADCLETIQEIGVEYQELFQELGGERIDLVESLNDQDTWVRTVAKLASSFV